MGDQAVTSLYRKVVSPSVKFKTDGLSRETHARHIQYKETLPLSMKRLSATPTSTCVAVTRPHRSTKSAPSRDVDIVLKRSESPITAQENRIIQDKNYDFQPTTKFKTTSLPAMPMTSKYAQSNHGTARSIPVSVQRHSALSLPDKLHTSDFNPRILFTTQKQRQLSESKAKDECRRLKRKSEIIAHRVDKHYYLCGNKLPIKNRLDVDANDLLRLKLLAQNKQLSQYQAMKDSKVEVVDPRESPGGQLSSPTVLIGKEGSGILSSGQQSPRESEGKWAEDAKSETSSIDDIDQILAMKERRMKLCESSRNQQNTPDGTPDGIEKVETDNKDENYDTKENVDNNINEGTFITEAQAIKVTIKDNENDGDKEKGDGIPEKQAEVKPNEEDEEVKTKKPNSSKAKIKNLRFKDDVIKTPTNQRKSTSANQKKKLMEQKKEEKRKEEQKDDDHVNPYLDEWLGIKKKEVDGRYKPGKPPPNRIFISSEISKAKASKTAKFSDMFLAETIALHEKANQNMVDITPETKFGIIGSKQKSAFAAMFHEIDKDKNGSVTLEELKMKMMPVVSRDDIKHFVQVFDLNKDKTVDSREFTAICCLNDRLAGTRTETADGSIALELEKLAQHIVIFKEMYKTMDEDDDNRLDVDEVLVIVSAAMGTEMGTDLSEARRVLSAARDEFGYIDFVGFMSFIPFFAKLLRAIMQNPLSINDIEKARERVRLKELTFKPKVVTKKEPKSWEAY